MRTVEEVKFVETAAVEAAKAEPVAEKKPRKRGTKVLAEVSVPVDETDKEKPEDVKVVLLGTVTYVNPYTGVVGFVCAGRGYQTGCSKHEYTVGETVAFMLDGGKIVLVDE